MKKLLWMLSVAFFASCATNKMALPEPYTTVSIVDYKFYTERGFFITESNSVSFEYTPVSSIVVKSVPGFLPGNYKPKVDPKINNDMYSSRGNVTDTKNPLFADVTVKSVLDHLYHNALSLEANGIINLKILVNQEGGYTITGMAIKR